MTRPGLASGKARKPSTSATRRSCSCRRATPECVSTVMPGLKREARLRAKCPGHPRLWRQRGRTWMAGTSPAMTNIEKSSGGVAERSVVALEMADVLLRVEFEPDALNQIQLGLEEVDVVLLVLHHALEHIARHVILDAVTIGGGLL